MNMRKALGYFLLLVSCLAWAALPVIPFLSISTVAKASWAGGLFVFAEVTWWLSIPLLGKEIIEWSRQAWQWCKSQLGLDNKKSIAQSTKNSDLSG